MKPLEVVTRYRDSQLQVGEKDSYFFQFKSKHLQILMFKGVVNCQDSRDKGPPEGNSARG